MARSDKEQHRLPLVPGSQGERFMHPFVLCSSAEVASVVANAVTLFTNGESCRSALRQMHADQRIIVDSTIRDVEPVNLVAALRKDAARRGIYLIANDATPSQLSRAWTAGASDVITSAQARRLMLDAQEELSSMVPSVEKLGESFGEPHSVVAEPEGVAFSAASPIEDAVVSASATPLSSACAVQIPGGGIVLSFLSGSGGTGKSTLSLIMALLLKRIGVRVVLIDLDLQFGDLRFLADGEPTITNNDMPFTEANSTVLAHYLDKNGFCFISPPSEPERAEELTERIAPVIEAARDHSDFVILNTGSFWNELHALVLENSDLICLVMDQRATSINTCKRCVELCIRLEVPFSRLLYILNRCSYRAAFSPFDCSLMVGGAPVYGIDNGGSLVEELLELGTPGELIDSKNAAVCSVAEMIDGFLREFAYEDIYLERLKPFLRKKYLSSIKKKTTKGGGDDAF